LHIEAWLKAETKQVTIYRVGWIILQHIAK